MNSIINKFAAGLSSMDPTTDIGEKELAVIPGKLGLSDRESKHFCGVASDLPSGLTVGILQEAVRIGRAPLAAALQSVQALSEAGPGPSRRRLMDDALGHMSDFETVLLGCQARSTDTLLRPLQGVVKGLIKNIEEQSPDLLPRPLDHYGLELWAETGALYLIDDQNKRRNERVIPLVYGTALADIKASLESSPVALIFLALLEIEERCEWSQDLHELIEEAMGRMANHIARQALKRLTPEQAPED